MLTDRLPSARVTTPDRIESAFDDQTDLVVVASWRPAPALCERVDELAHASGIPWLPVVDEHPSLLIGPCVTPRTGPCFRCYADRRAQHDAHYEDTQAVHRAFDRAPGLGPSGYLPGHARVAAGVVLRVLGRPAEHTGSVVRVSKQDMSLHRHTVVPCHGCPRCLPEVERPSLRDLLDPRSEESVRVS
ncbi:TOMM precursor leader peptide-binding protein [Streptomyces coelicoflavus]|uniref:TOMM precursor leader peptide-binding protein n=1 Tax=Streptomyces coelicoflavus TaxID=285562 RepID=UPI002E2539EE